MEDSSIKANPTPLTDWGRSPPSITENISADNSNPSFLMISLTFPYLSKRDEPETTICNLISCLFLRQLKQT